MNGIYRYINKEDVDKLMKLDLYTRCRILVTILFMDKFDKEGKPYIGHLVRVSDSMSTLDGKILGLIHDVIEDISGISYDDLIRFGITPNIIEALKLVTNDKSIVKLSKLERIIIYNKKIDKIIASGNRLAIELKYRDMSDNYDKERLKNLSREQQEWFKIKYGNNIKKLEKRL